MSLEVGRDEDHDRTMQQLRLALIECYVSILHGLHDCEEEGQGFQQVQAQPPNNAFIEPQARSIHEYLESLLD